MNEDLLNAKLEVTPACEIYIRKAGRQYNTMAVLFSLMTLAGWIGSYWRIKAGLKMEASNWMNTFNYLIYPVALIFYGILTLMQLYYYYKGIKFQNKAISDFNQPLFEKSFRFYFMGNMLSIISMVFYLCMEAVMMFELVELGYY